MSIGKPEKPFHASHLEQTTVYERAFWVAVWVLIVICSAVHLKGSMSQMLAVVFGYWLWRRACLHNAFVGQFNRRGRRRALKARGKKKSKSYKSRSYTWFWLLLLFVICCFGDKSPVRHIIALCFRRGGVTSPSVVSSRSHKAKSAYNRAIELLENQQYKEATVHFRASIATNPAYPDTHYNLAQALIGMDQLEQAEIELRKVISLNNEHASAEYSLGTLCLRLGNRDEGIKHLERAIALYDDNHPWREKAREIVRVFEEAK